jgi:selenocysteine lyase/cysteine desulfurase
MGPPEGVQYSADAGRFWGATFDSTPLYRFNGVRRMLDENGLTTADVSAHADRLSGRFFEALEAGECGRLGEAVVLNPPPGDNRPRARFLALKHRDAQRWRADLLAANVVTDVRDDVIRFGFGLYQDEVDVERLIGVCRRLFG